MRTQLQETIEICISEMPRFNLPGHVEAGLVRYLRNRIEPGAFLLAVLANDLRAACANGDDLSIHRLRGLVQYLHNCVPAACWGSPDKVGTWLAGRIG